MGRLPDADAASQHSLSSVVADDLPPPYTDVPEQGPSSGPSALPSAPIHLRLVDSAYALPDSTSCTTDKCAISLAPALSRNSHELFHVIRRQMKLPPRPLLYVKGSHTESGSGSGKKNDKNAIVDFEFKLDLAETMLTGWEGDSKKNTRGESWAEEDVLNDQDYKLAFRGGRMKSTTYKATAPIALHSEDSGALLASDPELGIDGAGEQPGTDNEAHLNMWCKRFCNDPSPVKSFTLHRQIQGFDHKAMRNVLDSHIRELNYHGSLSFCYRVAQESVTIYSPHWINRMRANRYVWWIFVVLQLWIISWPIIWFMEKRYELVHTRWYAQVGCPYQEDNALAIQYARGLSPTQLGEYWANAVKRAAWNKRSGEATLTRMDAERAHGLGMQQLLGLDGRTDSQAEQERRARVNNGNAGFVDHVVGLVRGVGEVSQDWRLTVGWGNNS